MRSLPVRNTEEKGKGHYQLRSPGASLCSPAQKGEDRMTPCGSHEKYTSRCQYGWHEYSPTLILTKQEADCISILGADGGVLYG